MAGKSKKGPGCLLAIVIIVTVVIIAHLLAKLPRADAPARPRSRASATSTPAGRTRSRGEVLAERLSYLTTEVPEIAWVEVDDNDVYIGFKQIPDDMDLIVRFAAVNGNTAINFGVHVWAVPATSRGWRPGTGPYYQEVTARYGRVED